MNILWNECEGGVWCPLNSVNLGHHHFNNLIGVYVIFHSLHNPRTVRVGQGSIKDRIEAHRTDPEVQAYNNLGLYVTWASVQTSDLDGVEVFLAQYLKPLVGEKFPNVPPIPVNLPW